MSLKIRQNIVAILARFLPIFRLVPYVLVFVAICYLFSLKDELEQTKSRLKKMSDLANELTLKHERLIKNLNMLNIQKDKLNTQIANLNQIIKSADEKDVCKLSAINILKRLHQSK